MKTIDLGKSKPILEESQINNIFKNKEIIKCINCNEIPIINIIQNYNNVLIFCINHQNNCDYSTFLSKCSVKCPNCFGTENIIRTTSANICNRCKKSFDISDNKKIIHKCLSNNYTSINEYYCLNCREYLCNKCKSYHNNSHSLIILRNYFLKNDEENFVGANIKRKEEILNNIIEYINNIQNNNNYKEKANQLLILLEEKKKEIIIEKLIMMNYKEYKYNYSIIVNAINLLKYEKEHFKNICMPLYLIQSYDINYNKHLNYIRSYLQNGYKPVKCNEQIFTIKNFANNKQIYRIHNKNIKSICPLNESLIISGSWDCFINIYNIFINQTIYSIEQPSMIFNLKKYPLITKKINSINNHGILVCLYCELIILNIQEKNSKILGHSIICKIRGFGNFIWTAIILQPNKKIISACLDNRLSAHKLLPNDTNTNKDINYCLIYSNLNKEKETITSLLQIDEHNFVSSSSLDLSDEPSIKFWNFKDNNDDIILEKTIYDVYCCQYPNSICKINENIIGFALEYTSLRGILGGIALIDKRYKEIISLVNTYNISCICSINENRFFTCGFDKKKNKRFLKEFKLEDVIREIGSLEIFHYDDIINIEIINESDLMILSSDEGKITVFDNYSICENKK